MRASNRLGQGVVVIEREVQYTKRLGNKRIVLDFLMTTDVIRIVRGHLKAPAIVPMNGSCWCQMTLFGWIGFHQIASAQVNVFLTGAEPLIFALFTV